MEFIRNIDGMCVRQYLYSLYVYHKTQSNFELMNKNKQYFEHPLISNYIDPANIKDMSIYYNNEYSITKEENKQSDSEICFYVNDFRNEDDKVDEKENFLIMKISESIKYKIRSDKMKRSIELFRTKTPNFFSVVARFHLPVVRAYYNGNNVYMLPSCISALMTGINIEYKYFAGVRNPCEIINKYLIRGFNVLLNDKELEYWNKYNEEMKTEWWSKPFTGAKSIKHNMFKPLLIKNIKTRTDYSSGLKTPTQMNPQEIKKWYGIDDTFSVDITNFRTINKDGSVAPYNPTVIKLLYDAINNN